jgi:hypothetical protein
MEGPPQKRLNRRQEGLAPRERVEPLPSLVLVCHFGIGPMTKEKSSFTQTELPGPPRNVSTIDKDFLVFEKIEDE